MIVNPQLFNYKLIIGSLIIGIASISFLSWVNYNTVTSSETFVKNENKLIQSELRNAIDYNTQLHASNNELLKKLENSKLENAILQNQLREANNALERAQETKKELKNSEFKNNYLKQTIDSLITLNTSYNSDKFIVLNRLQKSNAEVKDLKTKNEALQSLLEKASHLSAAKISASTYKSKDVDIKEISNKARNVKAVNVSVILSQNPLITTGEKDIYIQILNPKGNVIADKGSVSFGNSTLIYSNKQSIIYKGDNFELETMIEASENDKPLLKGEYIINVFYDDKKLGSTRFELN